MAARDPKTKGVSRLEETLSPVRNFTIRLEDRIRAADGPPAYIRRKRAIEDIEESLLRSVRKLAAQIAADGGRRAELYALAKSRLNLDEINRLIGTHNRFYPAEAQLPLHPRTGLLLERGQPWRPLELMTLDRLVDRVLEERRSA